MPLLACGRLLLVAQQHQVLHCGQCGLLVLAGHQVPVHHHVHFIRVTRAVQGSSILDDILGDHRKVGKVGAPGKLKYRDSSQGASTEAPHVGVIHSREETGNSHTNGTDWFFFLDEVPEDVTQVFVFPEVMDCSWTVRQNQAGVPIGVYSVKSNGDCKDFHAKVIKPASALVILVNELQRTPPWRGYLDRECAVQ